MSTGGWVGLRLADVKFPVPSPPGDPLVSLEWDVVPPWAGDGATGTFGKASSSPDEDRMPELGP